MTYRPVPTSVPRTLASLVALWAVAVLVHAVPAAGKSEDPPPVESAVRLDVPFVVTQLPVGTAAERGGPLAGGMLRSRYGEGARLVAVFPDGRARVLTGAFHSACDPDISFDATHVLFAGKKKASDPWNVYEMRSDGTQIRQVTQGLGHCRSPSYQSTLYTIVSTEPWYQLTFVSDRAGGHTEHGGAPATDLYSCKLDGSAVRRLTFNLSSDMDPWMKSDGRVLLASWQRATLGRGPLGRIALFGINTDGADYALFADTAGKRIKHMPCTTTSGLAVFVEGDTVPWDGAGTLSCVDLRRPLHTYRPITSESQGFYHSPSPLPDGRILVARRPADGSATHGIHRLDPRDGRAELVFDDPRFHDIQARGIVPRSEPDGRSSVVTEEDPHGKLYCLNMYLSDLEDRSWMPPGTIKRLRVLEGIPLAAEGLHARTELSNDKDPSYGNAALHGIPPLAQRRILGEIDVETEGSFSIEVPASTPIELQILDEDGMALRTCSWIWAKNHEPRGCIGCHEDGELTPENWFVDALSRKPIPLHLPPERRRTVDFRRDVMPVIEAKCVVCHHEGGDEPRLDGAGPAASGGGNQRPFNPAYRGLLSKWPGKENSGDLEAYKYVHPGRARNSRLIWHLFGRNTSRPWDGELAGGMVTVIPPGSGEPLSEDEKRTFVEWVDMGALWDGIPEHDPPPDPNET